jgi:NAD(P)-dependent dehydrogenase (short-subunit alcohol dehydrogenase family)
MSKLSVITGGAGGMGLAAAHVAGREGAVVVADLDSARLAAAKSELIAAGVDCATVTCDITDHQSVAELVKKSQQMGPVTSVIHTAGVSPSMGSAELIVGINALGTVLVNRAFLEIAHDGMAIVNVASVAGHQLPGALAPRRRYKHAFGDVTQLRDDLVRRCNLAPRRVRPQLAYMLSKNFVIWYSRAMAAHFGSKGARVVSVSPGSFDTAMGKLEEPHGAGAMMQIGALKRFGHPTEIAELLAFVAGDKPGYLTGTDIVCDGGVMAGMSLKKMLTMGRNQ